MACLQEAEGESGQRLPRPAQLAGSVPVPGAAVLAPVQVQAQVRRVALQALQLLFSARQRLPLAELLSRSMFQGAPRLLLQQVQQVQVRVLPCPPDSPRPLGER